MTSHLGPNIALTSYGEDDEYTLDGPWGPDGAQGAPPQGYQCIRFEPFQPAAWAQLCDPNLQEV